MLGHHWTYVYLCSYAIISIQQITEVNSVSGDRYTINFDGYCSLTLQEVETSLFLYQQLCKSVLLCGSKSILAINGIF